MIIFRKMPYVSFSLLNSILFIVKHVRRHFVWRSPPLIIPLDHAVLFCAANKTRKTNKFFSYTVFSVSKKQPSGFFFLLLETFFRFNARSFWEWVKRKCPNDLTIYNAYGSVLQSVFKATNYIKLKKKT